MSVKYLVPQVKVVDTRSPFHLQQVDMLLNEQGHIESIAPKLEAGDAQIFAAPGLHVSLGWMDLKANFCDPGREDRETLTSGARAALAGGFSTVALSPQTHPVLDSKADIEYILGQAQKGPVELLPYAAFTQGLLGEELSDMEDLLQAGALALSHGDTAVSNSAVMKLALLYARDLQQSLRVQSYEAGIRQKGVMHEGPQSTRLGLSGIPALAETLSLQRDIHLARYCEAPLHFTGLSSAESVAILAQAQKAQEGLSAEVNLLNLVLNDQVLSHYDSHYKIYPPLRGEDDRRSLVQALRKGSISGIASNHQPRTIEEKQCEFDLAQFGAATLEIFFGALWGKLHGEMPLEELIELITRRPRLLTGHQAGAKIAVGEKVPLSFFDPEQEWQLDRSNTQSTAANYPQIPYPLRGKALAVFSKGQFYRLSEL